MGSTFDSETFVEKHHTRKPLRRRMPTVSTMGATMSPQRTERIVVPTRPRMTASYFAFSNSSVLYAFTTRTHVRISWMREPTTE